MAGLHHSAACCASRSVQCRLPTGQLSNRCDVVEQSLRALAHPSRRESRRDSLTSHRTKGARERIAYYACILTTLLPPRSRSLCAVMGRTLLGGRTQWAMDGARTELPELVDQGLDNTLMDEHMGKIPDGAQGAPPFILKTSQSEFQQGGEILLGLQGSLCEIPGPRFELEAVLPLRTADVKPSPSRAEHLWFCFTCTCSVCRVLLGAEQRPGRATSSSCVLYSGPVWGTA